jgi:hypothetical protein
MAQFVEDRLAEDKAFALKASGGTVVGEPGNWQPAPTGDEWEVHADLVEGDFGPDGDLEVLVALRPGLPRPPAESPAYWGTVVSWKSEGYPNESAPESQFRHMARHDPARALRQITAIRHIIAMTEEHMYNEEPTYREFAAIWSDHPAYKAEWAPENGA